MDRYTKVVLTLIAFALWANLIAGVMRPIGEAQAQMQGGPQQVVIVGYAANTALPIAVPQGSPGLPVYPAPQTGPIPVNLVGVNGHSLSDPAVTIPVTVADVTGVGGTSVRGTGGIPVNPGSKVMPVAVTSVNSDVSVIVKRMPPGPTSQSQSTSMPAPGSTTSTLPGN